jgi:hypothetical protein
MNHEITTGCCDRIELYPGVKGTTITSHATEEFIYKSFVRPLLLMFPFASHFKSHPAALALCLR